MKKILVFIIAVIALQPAFSIKKITYSDFIELVKKGGLIENYYVMDFSDYPGKDKESNYYIVRPPYIEIDTSVKIRNCEFDYLLLQNFSFNGSLIIENCNFRQYEKGLGNNIRIAYSQVDGNIEISNIRNNNKKINIAVHYCKFIKLDVHPSPIDFDYNLKVGGSQFSNFSLSSINRLYIYYCEIGDSTNNQIIEFGSSLFYWEDYYEIDLRNNSFFSPVSLSGLNLTEHLHIISCEFKYGLQLNNLVFSLEKAIIDWESIHNSIIAILKSDYYLKKKEHEFKLVNSDNYYPFYDTALSQRYRSLRRTYATLINYYRGRSQFEEANAIFRELKEVELEYFKKKTQNSSGYEYLSSGFSLLFLNFLKHISDYTTNASKILFSSFFIVLFFSILYWLYTLFITKPLETLKFLRFIIVKTIFLLFFLFHYVIFIFLSINLFSKRNERLLHEIKFKPNISIVPYKIDHPGCTFYLLFLREPFVSFVASINFFVTLGYSGVNIKGKIKYIAVFEGLIGWLILIIVSATLINNFLVI